MKILITGGSGFLGKHLIRHLLAEKYHVIALLRKNSDISRLPVKDQQLSLVFIEELDYDNFFKAEAPFSAMVHCATNYGRTATGLSEVLQDNLMWPTLLLEYGIKYSCGLFINTDTFFAKQQKAQSYLQAYVLSKYLFREILKAKSSIIPVVNCRLEHVYGPEDGAAKFTTYILRELLKNAETIELSDGWQKRDFVYIEDVARAYALILNYLPRFRGFSEYEIGTGESHSIREFVTTLKNMIPGNNTILDWGALPMRRNEIEDSFADISALLNLGWAPKFDLNKGIYHLLEHHKVHGI
ncbi:NAD(P)-dependent oxidoreductase [Chitinophaga sp. XS-30]|uniref:NAD-dependent epimerase/dehydratase family protein n=1 Tax=Chitinophaga sp. XS-30 TaxID=2604421 RepID=UPI0011DD0DF3|nr:NAD(P)-dependent oxidoreductase [Chitinophaga sp. XS-30]QEH39752.1 NAD(P)-dependent oxidoreductase [Chitinophaga sp. XS-30]